MSMFGSDADELERIAAEFRSTADEIDGEATLMTRTLSGIEWLGAVAVNFQSGWTGVQVKQLELSTRFIREAADALEKNARQQRETSRAGSENPSSFNPMRMLAQLAEIIGDSHALDLISAFRDISEFGDKADDLMAMYGLAGLGLELVAESLDGLGHQNWALLSDYTAQVINIGATVYGVAPAFQQWSAMVGSAAPAIGIISGFIGGVADVGDLMTGGAEATEWWSLGGHGATVAGSVMLLTPAAPIGAAFVIGGAVVEGGLWIHENWDQITEMADDARDIVDDLPGGQLALDVVDAHLAVADAALDGIKNGFETIGSWF